MKKNITLYLLTALLLTAVIVTYSNHFDNPFHFDDSHTIVNNAFIRNIRNIPLFFLDSTTSSSLPTNQAYRPIVTATTAIDYWLGNGLKPFYFHLSTFILFLIQGMLMYFFYLKIFDLSWEHDWNPFIALFSTAWYLLHPANAETINYVLARSDSISTLFVVLAFVLYLYSPVSRKYYLYLIPVALGGLTKPTAAMFGTLLLAYILLFEEKIYLINLFNKNNSSRLVSALRKVAVAFIFCTLMFAFTRAMDSSTWVPGGTSRFHYLITQPYVLLHYFTTFFAPISLSADTDWRPLESIMDIRFVTGLSFVAVLFFIAVAASKKEKFYPVSFGILWFFISLIPTSTVIPLAEVMNDHRLFFPYIGLMMSVSWAVALALSEMKKSFRPGRAFEILTLVVIALVLTGNAYGTHERNKVWKTEESLWRDVTEKSPRNGRGLMNYGVELMAKADYASAEKYFMRALEFTPQYPYLHINIAILKAATDRPEEAEQYFKKAISLGPGYPVCYYYYSRFLKDQKRYSEAVQNLNKLLGLASAHLDARHELMSIYLELGDIQKLTELATQTLQIVPEDKTSARYLDAAKGGRFGIETTQQSIKTPKSPEDFLSLSLEYYKAKKYKQSIRAARAALKLKPEYDLAYNNICAAYNELRQWDKAIEAGEKALKINPNNQRAKNNLNWAISQKKLQAK